MPTAPTSTPHASHTSVWLWVALIVFAAALYLFGLGGSYAPTNGDEMVYIHIARLTAATGHWLPLQSDIVNLRNTKPPFLFWQAMVAGDWGNHWTMFALRLPSVVYSFFTAGIIAALTHRIANNWRTACLAAVVYLAFFSTFRYGRAYLTSGPETFWLALPVFYLLWNAKEIANTPIAWKTFTWFGLAIGVGLLYKSFALVAPAAATLWFVLLWLEPTLQWRWLLRTTLGVTWSALLALGIFSLWFVIDPNPSAVWQEFVVAENAGKMSGSQGYWHAALFGDYPLWTQLLAYPENSGLMWFVVMGLAWAGVSAGLKNKVRTRWMPAQGTLMIWLLVWLVIFSIPSQRSARYVIPAMPALAMVLALYWDRIARFWFFITLGISAIAFVILGRIAWVMGNMGIGSEWDLWTVLTLTAAGGLAAIAGVFKSQWTRNSALFACLCVYASFSAMVAPLDSPAAQYSEAVKAQLQGKRIAVPNGFTGQYERFGFVLPGNTLIPYDAEGRNTGALHPDMPPAERLVFLLENHDAVVWLQEDAQRTDALCAAKCKVLGQRWHVKSRHREGEITWSNLWHPDQWLFGREWLVTLHK